MKTIIAALIGLFALAEISLAATFSKQTLAQRRKTQVISVGLLSFPKTLDPRDAVSFQHFLVVQSLYQTLVRINEQGNLTADLASRWQISTDGKVCRFTLNEHAVFQDGSPITARDVAISISRHFWPGSSSVVRGFLEGLLVAHNTSLKENELLPSIKVIDEHNLEFRLKDAYPPFLYLLAMPGFSIVKNGRELLGSGPMVVQQFVPTVSLNLKRSPTYSGSATKVNELQIHAITNASAAEKDLTEKKLDLLFGITPAAASALNLPAGYRAVPSQSLAFLHLFFNCEHPLFSRPDFRRDFAALLQGLAEKRDNQSPYYTFQPSYIPRGVLPASYYQRRLKPLIKEEFIQHWQGLSKGDPLRLVFTQGVLPPGLLKDLEDTLQKSRIKYVLRLVAADEYRKLRSENSYDVISGLYMGNFPDPDGFIDPLNSKLPLHYGVFSSDAFFKKLGTVKYLSPLEIRLERYSTLLIELENQYFFAPLFRVNLPIIHAEGVHIPDTSYRYEAELWNMFWND